MNYFNIKIDIPKIVGISTIIIILLLVIFKVLNHSTIEMNNSNFTTILRESHNNLEKYLGKRIKTSGYIFRRSDFPYANFVIARDMLISENEANIVGFYCTYEFANEFENNQWVEATGTIILGDYFGPIPILKIDTIHKINTPNDIFVNPPN